MLNRYFVLNKPANIVSQFVSSDTVPLLGSIAFLFPKGTHAIGRLDKDSEGLLLLTTDKKITRLIFSEAKAHERSYLVMAQNEMTQETFDHFSNGVIIKVKKGDSYLARPKMLERVSNPVSLYPWAADAREIYPHTWFLITLTEGKYRQIRKMTLALKHRCLRLIRLTIEDITLDGVPPGAVKELDQETFYRLARIE